MSLRGRALDWAWAHPRWKRPAREAWALARTVSRTVHLQRLFEPPEFGDLRRLAGEVEAAEDGSGRVLFLTFRGWSTHAVIETVLGHALQRRGWEPVFLTCGGRLPICDVMPAPAAPPMPCRSCSEYSSGAIRAAGFEYLRLGDLIDVPGAVAVARARVAALTSVRDCEEFASGGLLLGELVRTSVAWFLSRGSLPEEPRIARTYRDFLTSGLVVAEAFEKVLRRLQPDRVVLLNGRFFAEGILATLASRRGIGWTTYEKGMLSDTLVTAPGGFASDVIMPDDEVERALAQPLNAAENDKLDRYLSERRAGEESAGRLRSDQLDDLRAALIELGLTRSRPLVVMFSNVVWDSAVVGKDRGFASIRDWLIAGIQWAGGHPDVDLVIRIHPAEVNVTNHATLERMADFIAEGWPRLPTNVRIVPPESRISSYALMDGARIGLVYTSTVGLEMAMRGIPVVVAGSTHYRGHGFTVDPETLGSVLAGGQQAALG